MNIDETVEKWLSDGGVLSYALRPGGLVMTDGWAKYSRPDGSLYVATSYGPDGMEFINIAE